MHGHTASDVNRLAGHIRGQRTGEKQHHAGTGLMQQLGDRPFYTLQSVGDLGRLPPQIDGNHQTTWREKASVLIPAASTWRAYSFAENSEWSR